MYYRHVRIPTKVRIGCHPFKCFKSWKLQVKPSSASGDLEIWSLGWKIYSPDISFQTWRHVQYPLIGFQQGSHIYTVSK